MYVTGQIKKTLKEKKITQEKLAEMIGGKPSWLSHVLSGKRSLKMEDFIKIMYALCEPPSKFLPKDLVDVAYNNTNIEDHFRKIVKDEIIKFHEDKISE